MAALLADDIRERKEHPEHVADAHARVVVDWSVVVKGERPLEAQAADALLRTWEQQTLAVCAPPRRVLVQATADPPAWT
jgi:hypothetical protein